MTVIAYAFEATIGATARSDRKRTYKYVEDASQLASRLWPKRHFKKRAMLDFGNGGAWL